VIKIKIFLDSAKISEIKEARELGIIDGVTTNPSLIKKALQEKKRQSLESYIKDILKICKGIPVSLEVTKYTYKEMIEEAKTLFKRFNKINHSIYIKIPINPAFNKNKNNFDGIRAIRTLSKKRIPVNCTLIFTPEQALLAAKAGAKIVSPFTGRIDDFIRQQNKIRFKKPDYFPASGIHKKGKILEDNGIISGVDLIAQCVAIIKAHNYETEVLAASIRNPRQLREVALAGADIATVPFYVLEQSLIHKKTTEGMEKFVKDTVKEYANLMKK
jgi:transaldolase